MDRIVNVLYPLKRSAIRIGVATALLAVLSFGLINPRTVIFTADYELVYEEGWESSACIAPDTCYMLYRLTLGNTGHQVYKDIELHFTGLPKDMQGWNFHTVELKSTTRRIPKATAVAIDGLSYHGFQVHDLHPETAVVIEFMDLQRPRTTAERLLQNDAFVHVFARGSVLQGNPRATVFARFMTFFL